MNSETVSVIDRAIAVLEEAKGDVASADAGLEKALADIRVAPRADKIAVSSAIESALERLRAARSKVDEAERTLAAERAKSV